MNVISYKALNQIWVPVDFLGLKIFKEPLGQGGRMLTWAKPEYIRPMDLKSRPSEQLTTMTYMPRALPRSLTVSVFPVPAGPLGEPPRCRCKAVVSVM